MRLDRRPSHYQLLPSLLIVAAVLPGTTASASPKYTIVDLGTLSGTTSSAATAINDRGQIVGVSYNANEGRFRYGVAESPEAPRFESFGGGRSFLYQTGSMGQADSLGGPASDLNELGQIVGGEYRTAINDAGQYAGVTHPRIGSYSGATSGDIPTHMSMVYDINNQGTAVGALVYNNPFTGYSVHPTVFQDGKLTYLYRDPNPNSREGIFDGRALAINDNDQILVYVREHTTGQHASYLYDLNAQTRIDLTKLPGGEGKFGVALNDRGEVVGNDFLYDGSTLHKLTDLLTSPGGWSGLDATDINNDGWIVGQGTIDGRLHAFLMAPEGAQVPEPAALIAWTALAACLAWRTRRGRRLG